jgi:hypothetical protein
MKFRKKPVVVDVILWDGGNKAEIDKFVGHTLQHAYNTTNDVLIIETLEGDMLCSKGDIVIKGIKGECYPCKPDIFEATYEEVK